MLLIPLDILWPSRSLLLRRGERARSNGVLQVTAAIIRSFQPDSGIVRVLLAKTLTETSLRVRGSDKSVVARLPLGEPIEFELVRDRRGRDCAIDVAPICR
jgi:hypothetical protein